MEEIDLKDFWQFYKKYSLSVIIVCLLFLIAYDVLGHIS